MGEFGRPAFNSTVVDGTMWVVKKCGKSKLGGHDFECSCDQVIIGEVHQDLCKVQPREITTSAQIYVRSNKT